MEKNFKTKYFAYIIEFVFYSFSGWLYETVAETLVAGHFVLNRGSLHIPICMIYGFGSFIMLFLFNKLPKRLNAIQVFFGGLVITTAFEYISALFIEYVMHTTMWDYSNWPVNFQGRISLISSIVFAVGCVAVYCSLHSKIQNASAKHPKVAAVIATILGATVVVDFIISLTVRITGI